MRLWYQISNFQTIIMDRYPVCKTTLRWMPQDLADDYPTLVRIMNGLMSSSNRAQSQHKDRFPRYGDFHVQAAVLSDDIFISKRPLVVTWTSVDQDLWRHMASLCHNKLKAKSMAIPDTTGRLTSKLQRSYVLNQCVPACLPNNYVVLSQYGNN